MPRQKWVIIVALTIGAVLALLAFAVAVFPFAGRRFLEREKGVEGTDAQVHAADKGEYAHPISEDLEAIYQGIRVLQLERELGRVPEGLYREQLNAYRLQAARILREHEEAEIISSDTALEEEIRLARAGLAGIADEESRCPNCARPISKEGDNCSECGVTLTDLGAS